MTRFGAHQVAFRGATDPSAPLVVLLHGRGSNEQQILTLAEHLPEGPQYAAVRAPIAEGGGFAWFANRGIGRPVAESLAETMAWFRAWLDEVAPAGRPVVLVGFSGGAAFAGGLVLSEPQRYAGAAILYGTLPFDAGVPVETAALTGLPVFVAQGDQDTVIPRELLDRTWDHLLNHSGAAPYARRDPGGHGISPQTLGELGGWLQERLGFVRFRGAAPVGLSTEPVRWTGLPDGGLPRRRGDRPRVQWWIPQQQVSDNAPAEVQEQLFARVVALGQVETGQSAISVPGARGFFLDGGDGTRDAFLVPSAREFAHLHPGGDGSLHVALPVAHAADAVVKGWAQAHPLAGVRLTPGMVMVYGPRDEAELEVVTAILSASHAYARGTAA